MAKLTHFDATGAAVMVDVSAKAETERVAVAGATVLMEKATLDLIMAGGVKKGDVLSVARLAGIMGAKRTPDLIPLCHPIAVHGASVDLEVADDSVNITATVRTADRTGVEMEALTAVTVADLTVVDMVKAIDPASTITDVQVMHKTGGVSGDWRRTP